MHWLWKEILQNIISWKIQIFAYFPITINVPLFKKMRDIIFFGGETETAQKVIAPPKKNYVPNFLKQRDIGNFMSFCNHGPSIL
jgi:hypothetical protein